MRDYGRVRSCFWSDEKVVGLGVGPKLLACYLMSCSHGNAIGCFRLPIGYMAEDLRQDSGAIRADMAALEDAGFVLRDAATGWTLLPNYLRHNSIENPNIGRSCEKLADAVPDSFPHLDRLLHALKPHAGHLPAGFLERLSGRASTVREGLNGDRETLREGFYNGSMKPFAKGCSVPVEPFANKTPSHTHTHTHTQKEAPAAVASPDPAKRLIGTTMALLMGAGVKEQQARSLIGKWRKSHGDAALLATVGDCARLSVAEPIGWITKALEARAAAPQFDDLGREILSPEQMLARHDVVTRL